ncbi:MAG: glycosyltransferase family 2 protein [Deltaproteobacteria bacterium]|nr:glycosyltransferase family 2 protein [Deltaproteobacteria bacterium]MBW1818939.1 glycosyltransferase family 2 protein [Deltaproteobacteria bacterium]
MNTIVIVPVFNEWPHLLTVLNDLRAHFSDILVVDDGSDDTSYLSHLMQERYDCISLPFNLGHWGAVQAGFRYALEKNWDAAVTFDGDGQHLPGEINKLTTPIVREFDVVIGGFHRRGGFMKQSCRWILKRLSGVEIYDFTSGFRSYSRHAMRTLMEPMFQNFEYQDLAVLMMAQKKGLKMLEVPVRMSERLGEKSKVFPNLYSILRYFLITFTFILVRRP